MRHRLLLAAHESRGHPIRYAVLRAQALERKRKDDGDLKLFAVSFTAFFVCFYTFLI